MILASIVFLLCLLGYLLWMPLELYLDSSRERYYLRIGTLAKASVEKDPAEILKLHLKVLFLNFYWRPSDLGSFLRKNKRLKPKKKSIGSLKISKRSFTRLLGSFKIKHFLLELDTGNPVLNSKLFPIFFLINRRAADIRINFQNRNHIALKVANRPIRIINAMINF